MTHYQRSAHPRTVASFASPPSGGYAFSSPNAGLPYPSSTPYPSRTNTPAYSAYSSPSNSSGSFGKSSVYTASASKSLKSALKGKKRSQTAPWQQSSPTGSYHASIAGNPTPVKYSQSQGRIGPDMSYYQYYQQGPGWGGAGYEPLPPPMPSYQPAPSWGGYDYYQAHSGDNDRTLFDSLWSRFKSAVGVTTQGFSRQHAKQIYRRVYGGVADLMEVPPEELGAAAGYEAIRLWEHHHNLYQAPLNHDLDREREALAGLAIGEANKLWARSNPYRSRHGRRLCAETALATAERIFTFQYDNGTAGVAPYLSPEQQYANRGLINDPALIRGPAYERGYERGYEPGYEPEYVGRPRTVSFSGYGGRRSRRGSFSGYDVPPQVVPVGGGLPAVSQIPMGVGGMGGIGGAGYTNPHGYNIVDGPMGGGVPFPGGDPYAPPSPRYASRSMMADPYDDYAAPVGVPGSYGGGGYLQTGSVLGAPSSVGSGGYGGGGYVPAEAYGVGGGYRRPRARSYGYGGGY